MHGHVGQQGHVSSEQPSKYLMHCMELLVAVDGYRSLGIYMSTPGSMCKAHHLLCWAAKKYGAGKCCAAQTLFLKQPVGCGCVRNTNRMQVTALPWPSSWC
jgi:hypothetical protein